MERTCCLVMLPLITQRKYNNDYRVTLDKIRSIHFSNNEDDNILQKSIIEVMNFLWWESPDKGYSLWET